MDSSPGYLPSENVTVSRAEFDELKARVTKHDQKLKYLIEFLEGIKTLVKLKYGL